LFDVSCLFMWPDMYDGCSGWVGSFEQVGWKEMIDETVSMGNIDS